MNEKLNTQFKAEVAIKKAEYIIGSFDADGNCSVSKNPTTHTSILSARDECKRLAALYPNKTFVILKMCGAERVVSTPRTFSI